MDLPKTGIIYLYEKTQGENAYAVPIEETPGDIQQTVQIRTTRSLFGLRWRQMAVMALLAVAVDGFIISYYPRVTLETRYLLSQARDKIFQLATPVRSAPSENKTVIDPLRTANGSVIQPVNTEFAIVVPKIGINAPIVEGVDPNNPKEYTQVLATGVAQSLTSFTPDKSGTVYLFSHSTNYDWFVNDLNAVFYLLKNLEDGDYIVLFYKGVRYTYRLTEKRVVSAGEISYLVPQAGKRNLILQTCWPPGSVTERLLLFADLVEEQGQK
ncbi:MAG: sortase [Candidatus Gottesmanbacteria bacterium]|nr:sortase [Candidatus Gottesmanbacteria bacterium]